MGHRVSPRWQPTIGSEKLAVPSLELDLSPFPDGFPLDRRVEPLGDGLEHFTTRHAEKERVVGGGEVLVVTALETDDVGRVGDELDGPSDGFGGSVFALGYGFFVVFGNEELVVVASESDCFGVVEKIHARLFDD